MLSILTCHLFQAYDKTLASVFNVGVQIFLVLSGFLYGRKQIGNWKPWWHKRIDRVYVPYFVFLTCTLPFYLFLHPEAMNWQWLPVYYLNLDGFRYLLGDFQIGKDMKIEGLRHVWFLTAIMFAYLSTGWMQRIREKGQGRIALLALFALVGIGYCLLPMRLMFTLAWIYLYAFGYFFSFLEKEAAACRRLLLLVLAVSLTFMLITRDLNYWSVSNRLLHDVVGIAAVVFGVTILSREKIRRLPAVVVLLDNYSFHIYLVHFIIMCGPFSLAHATPSTVINILLMLLATAILTWALASLEKLCRNVFKKVS